MTEETEYKTRRDLKREARREIKRRAVTEIGYPGPILVLNEGNRTGPVWHPHVVPHDDDTRRSLKRRYAKEVKAMAVNEVGYTGPVILLNKTPEPWVIEREDGRKAKIYMSPQGGDDVWAAFGRSYPQAGVAASDDVFFSPWHGESVDRRFTQDEDWDLAAWLLAPAVSRSERPAARRKEGVRSCSAKKSNGVCVRRLSCGATIRADRTDGIATITWKMNGTDCVQTLALNPGDFERIAAGADPVDEGWEDGNGNLVCEYNSRGPFAVVETWRNGIMDGRPETVTWYPTAEKAVRAAETAWGYLTPGERAKYRVVAVIPAPLPDEVLGGKALWDSEEGGAVSPKKTGVRSRSAKPAKKAKTKRKAQTRWVAMQMTRNGGDAQAVVCRDRGEAESKAKAMKRSRDPSARGRYVQGYARMDTSDIDVTATVSGDKGPFYEV